MTKNVSACSLTEIGSAECTIKPATDMVIINSNKAGRVMIPKITIKDPKNSAKTAKNKEIGSPMPIGSAKDQSPETNFTSFSQP